MAVELAAPICRPGGKRPKKLRKTTCRSCPKQPRRRWLYIGPLAPDCQQRFAKTLHCAPKPPDSSGLHSRSTACAKRGFRVRWCARYIWEARPICATIDRLPFRRVVRGRRAISFGPATPECSSSAQRTLSRCRRRRRSWHCLRGRHAPSADIGTEPPIEADGRRHSPEDHRHISLRWLSGTCLTGLTGALLIGAAVYSALDGQSNFAEPPTPAVPRAEKTDAAVNPRKGDRLVKSVDIVAAKQSFRTPTIVKSGEKE